jgi:hypothetical protein
VGRGEGERGRGFPQLPSFHTNHWNLRSIMKRISVVSQGKNLVRSTLEKQDKVGRNRKEGAAHFLHFTSRK